MYQYQHKCVVNEKEEEEKWVNEIGYNYNFYRPIQWSRQSNFSASEQWFVYINDSPQKKNKKWNVVWVAMNGNQLK